MGVEGKEEFNRRACEEGSKDGIYGAVDVMEREHVEKIVGG
jgi:hypothetical protein